MKAWAKAADSERDWPLASPAVRAAERVQPVPWVLGRSMWGAVKVSIPVS